MNTYPTGRRGVNALRRPDARDGATGGISRAYTWDAENRLIRVAPPDSPQSGDVKVELTYDYLGRRVQRLVYEHNGTNWGYPTTTKFLYNGRLMLVELDGSDDVVRTYTWGLDLAGLHTANGGPGRRGYPTSGGFLQAAGGIGGLLAVYDAGEADGYVYFHDANGNVGQVVAWENGYGGANGDDWHADRLVGRYEYSPFGEVVGPDDDADGDWRDDAGAFATDNPFRFSTKWHDDAIGVVDFGARMYSATLGRFLNRDPIAEAGGVNLYAFAANNPVNYVDPFGYYLVPCPNPGGCGELGSQLPVIGGGVPLPGAGGDGNVSGNCADMLCPTGWPATYCPTTGRCECPEAGCGSSPYALQSMKVALTPHRSWACCQSSRSGKSQWKSCAGRTSTGLSGRQKKQNCCSSYDGPWMGSGGAGGMETWTPNPNSSACGDLPGGGVPPNGAIPLPNPDEPLGSCMVNCLSSVGCGWLAALRQGCTAGLRWRYPPAVPRANPCRFLIGRALSRAGSRIWFAWCSGAFTGCLTGCSLYNAEYREAMRDLVEGGGGRHVLY